MNIAALNKLLPVYSGRQTAAHRAVHDAVTAVLRLECRSPIVISAADNLGYLYDEVKADLPDIQRAERYLIECWDACVPPTGVVFKG